MRLMTAVLLVAAACPFGKASADERYYALFFAHQTDRFQPEEAHTYVEYIRAEAVPGALPIILQRDAISWLPCTGQVRIYAMKPEPGRNFTLDETLTLFAQGKHILAWGPYEMTPHAYQLAQAQIAKLRSGAFMYLASDLVPGFNQHHGNCIHAAAEIDPESPRIGQYNIKFGDRATRQVIRAYVRRGFLCNPHLPHEDIYAQLGLEAWPIDRRNDWEQQGLVGRLVPRVGRR